jgi:hypothetical protein
MSNSSNLSLLSLKRTDVPERPIQSVDRQPIGEASHHEERHRRLLDPQVVAGWETEQVALTRELEETVLFQLCDLLILANYSGSGSIEDITERALKLLKPAAKHCKSASIARDRLVQAHGMTKYMKKDRCSEDHYAASPAAVEGRITDRQEYMRGSIISDLNLGRSFLAEARALRLKQKQASQPQSWPLVA